GNYASRFIATDVIALQPMLAGVTNTVDVRSYQVGSNGEPADGAPANVELRLVDRAGNERFNKAVQTNEIGHATLDLPGEVLEPGIRMEVAAAKQSQVAAAAPSDRIAQKNMGRAEQSAAGGTELPVQPEPQIAYFLCAEP